jgi:hypothetical protein
VFSLEQVIQSWISYGAGMWTKSQSRDAKPPAPPINDPGTHPLARQSGQLVVGAGELQVELELRARWTSQGGEGDLGPPITD